MPAGSKLTLAVIVLFGVLLGVYYGFVGPGGAAPQIGSPPAAATVAGEDLEGLQPVAPPVTSLPLRPMQPVHTSPWGPEPARNVQPRVPADSPGIRVLSFQETKQPHETPTPVGRRAGTTAFYTVRSDDSMWTIAREWLGSGARWKEIARINPGIDADRLDVGMKLRMPPKDKPEGAPAHSPAAGPPASGRRVHTVSEGDTLATIASRYLGSRALWESIYEANRGVIGDDPHRLEIGMELSIP